MTKLPPSGGAEATAVNPVQRKVERIINSKVETDPVSWFIFSVNKIINQEVLSALETVSDYFTENTPANRRNLRRMIENANVAAAEDFLATFTKVRFIIMISDEV